MKATLLFLIVTYSMNVSAQWTKIAIKGIGTIEIPPTMEVKAGEWKEITDKLYKIKEYQIPNIVIQPIGMNDLNKSAVNKFARIILTKIELDQPLPLGLSFQKEVLSKEDLKMINETFIDEIKSKNPTTVKFLEWYPLEVISINNMTSLRIGYKRSSPINPSPVVAYSYRFFNKKSAYEVTISYRESEKEIWYADLIKSLYTLKII